MFNFTGDFCKKNGNPFPTLESLRSLYIEYGGNEYELWHDYGDAYIMACKKFNVSKQDKEKWKREGTVSYKTGAFR